MNSDEECSQSLIFLLTSTNLPSKKKKKDNENQVSLMLPSVSKTFNNENQGKLLSFYMGER